MGDNPVIFVFGSNLGGYHGLGAAQAALLWHGAIYGQGIGREGNSYAIPTKDRSLAVLPLTEVAQHVSTFLDYARQHPADEFQVTRIGCGYAGFKDEEIAPLFAYAPENCLFDEKWEKLLPDRRYWGTY